MNNFFLLNDSLNNLNYRVFIDGMSELVAIEKERDDIFIKCDSIYNLNNLQALFPNLDGFAEQAIYKFIEQLKTLNVEINDENTFDTLYPNLSNAFLGINFLHTSITSSKQITNDLSYKNFNLSTLWNVTFRNFWSRRVKLFPNLILCGEVEMQISRIGNSGYFNQIIQRLKEFNSAVNGWTQGVFNYTQINANSSLRISPESASTMSRYANERRFSLPDGRTEEFELHIKAGNLRIHFFPDNQAKKIYIGYIGPHLSTVSN